LQFDKQGCALAVTQGTVQMVKPDKSATFLRVLGCA